MLRIGLFGGTFDPPHIAHVKVAEVATKRMKLDHILFIPCKLSPHKQNALPLISEVRLEMISIAISDCEWAEVTDLELKRDGLSYSIDTAEYFRHEYPAAQLFWIMGSDQWEVLDTWYRADDLANLVEFIVFPRPALPAPQDGKRLHVIDERIDISSSKIREYLFDGKDVSGYLHPEVESYIHSRGLYR